ncbi:dienelactone hydrolase family protein [Wenzhouxiangella sp. AB-CW3]|uniref:alpha/beta hydrolase n=1 Tax=Wenzhouxiangella sp. AB-CW3 TaxID=2771012 RepID=UPI00168B699B|nr:dienelactone hydrolase family protein [Wenzhouxiangella sp. AB-CW3]QOC21914.1 dienelactone hydrolase family protein [Wenzhouxiangella sp. AB-CW3]
MNEQDKRDRQEIFEVYTRRKVRAANIWLHGMGVNAEDLNPILVNLRQSREIGLHYIAPSAPIRRITVNQDRPTRAWFDVRGEPGEAPLDRDGMDESTRMVHDQLDRLRNQGRDPRHIILAGFSQGATLALHAGLRYPHSLAGIVVMSGELLFADSLMDEAEAASRHTPILMLHGENDRVVPITDARASRDALQASGYQIEWNEFPIEHTVSPEEVERVDDWIHQRLTETLAQ